MVSWTYEHTAAVRAGLPLPQPSELAHLNSAGCSLPSKRTLDTVIDYLQR
jgi:hypothetical protein